jgi:hypothetical protein
VTIDVHVILEADGTDNLDTGGKNVGGVRAHALYKRFGVKGITPS